MSARNTTARADRWWLTLRRLRGPAVRAVVLSVAILLIGTALYLAAPARVAFRPWRIAAPQHAIESLTVGDVTRPGIRLRLQPGETWRFRLNRSRRGELTVFVHVERPTAKPCQVEVRAANEPDTACRIETHPHFPAAWSRCFIAPGIRLRDFDLQVTLHADEPCEVLISEPVLDIRSFRRRPPVFVFLIDTVRADRLRTYNSAISIGVELDAFARNAIVFDELRSASSWTRTAVATLFSGLLPAAHRVLERGDVLFTALFTLPKVLRDNGYFTRAWSTNANILPIWGFAEGFDEFTDAGGLRWASDKTDGRLLLESVRKAVKADGGRPVFYYVHLMDAHAPYVPPASDLEAVLTSAALMETFPVRPSGEHGARVKDEYPKYLAELIDMDRALGEFFVFLQQEGVFDDSLILIVSDHGEEFLEHGEIYHGKTLYDEVLRVPAFLKLPGNARAGTRLRGAAFEDLMPTLLAALGIPAPTGIDGQDALATDEERSAAQIAVLKLDGRHLSGIVDFPWKLIIDHKATSMLFDLSRDPVESTDLAAEQPGQAAGLRTLLDAALAQREQGWHVRACAGAEPASIRFAVPSTWRLATIDFEESDRIVEQSGTKTIELKLGEKEVFHEVLGHISREIVTDHDELIAANQEVEIELRPFDGPLAFTLGSSRTIHTGVRILASMADARVPGSEPVECFTDVVVSHPYLRIWYTPGAEQLADSQVDPAVVERLRALGYRP